MLINSDVFLEYSKNKPNSLLLLIGQKLHHNSFGDCIVQDVIIDEDDFYDSSMILKIEHQSETLIRGWINSKKFSVRALNGQIIAEVSAPIDIMDELKLIQTRTNKQRIEFEHSELFLQQQDEERIRRERFAREFFEKKQQETRRLKLIEDEHRISEEKAWNEFKLLKEKYEVASFEDNSPLSELNRILFILEGEKRLSHEDEQWLKNNRLFPVLAVYNERLGNLAVAGSQWRKANNPKRALKISENLLSYDHFILTMRGGAYRDINELEKAKECALLAIKTNPEGFFAYNLLGAILFEQGLAEEGDEYIQKAIKLGSKPNEEDIRSALKKAGITERRSGAEYLLNKDPKRYEWAKDYL